jgi:hypothetical protein
MKKIILFGIFIITLFLITTPIVSSAINQKDIKEIINKNTTEGKALIDFSRISNEKPLLWWSLWKDFPERYEEFFEVNDIIDLGQTAYGITISDFDDDGSLDFAASWATSPWTKSTISIFYNNGNNEFLQEDVYLIEYHLRYIYDLDSGDYDNDGDIDLLFTYANKTGSTGNGTIAILFNDGTNNFGESEIAANLTPTSVTARINPEITSADFDNDGDIDFLVGDNSGLVEFYKNDGSGNFISFDIYDFGGTLSWGISSADFDNDGDIDFIATQDIPQENGCIYLILNDGSQNCFNQANYVKIADIPPMPSFFAGPQHDFGYLQSIDYNDDGMMDFFFSGGDSLYLYIQKEIGVFDYFHVMRLPMRNAEDGGWYGDDLRKGGIGIGDFNGDGLDDIIIGGVQGVVRMCYNNFVLVDIIHPDSASVYISDKIRYIPLMAPIMIYLFLKQGTAIVIGDLTVETKPLEPLQKVEFYINGRLKYTDYSEPFEWEWNRFSFGRYKIKAVPYDMDGIQGGFDEAIVWKFF